MTADANGSFRIAGLVPDTTVALQAELDGRLSDVVSIRVAPGMEQRGVILRIQ